MQDKLRQGRVKVYCPKCEEVYIPQRKFNLDGAFFGPSLVHMFLAQYKAVVVLPPARFYYEPKISGFAIAGKRGSKFFEPCKDEVQLTSERQARLVAQMGKKVEQPSQNSNNNKGNKK